MIELLGTGVGMAEREQLEKAAWEGEMFRLLAENVQDYALFIVDPQRHVLSWSKASERLLGFTEEEIVGKQCDCFFTPEDVQNNVPQRELDEARATGKGGDDRWHVRKDGSRFWSSGMATPLRDNRGVLRGFAKILRDRTDFKRTEEQLIASRRRLQALFDTALDAILLADDQGRYVDANPAACTLLGYDREEMLRRGVFDITPPANVEAGQLAWTAFLRDGQQSGEYAIRRHDGSTAVVEYRAVANILPGLHLSVLRDVSQRRQAEEALRQSEQRLRAISDNLPLGAVYQILGDEKGRRRFLYISAGVERLLGVTPADALVDADALYGLVHDEDRARVAAAEEVARRDQAPFDCEFRSWTRSGSLIWVHARSAPRPVPSGQTIWEGIILDVTDRKRAEADLARLTAESERRRRLYETALSNTADFNYTFDLQCRFTYVNEALLALWGKALHEAVGKNFFDLGYPPDLAGKLQQQIQQVIDTRQALRDETPYTSDGGTRQYEYIFVPVHGSGGTVEAVAGSTRDITERKALEVILRDQAKSLRDADRRKDEFLATLAHELRNPLAPLRNGLQLIKLASGNPEAVEQARNMMDRQLAQMVRLIDDLLDVSRITTGKLELRKQRIELANVVQSAVEGSRPFIEASGHRLTVSLPPVPLPLVADPMRLAQVFSNLLTNAAKYTDRGGRLSLTASRQPGEVVVAVRDSGIGIAPEHLPLLFEMFSQVNTALERSQGGLGIGLSLVKGLVEMHGGTVQARSEGLGRGSEFIVSLPAAGDTPNPASQQPASSEQATVRPRKRILVADDNRDAADSLAVLLRLGGHDVHAVHDGQEAVEAAGWFRPDLALLDIGMPKLNGLAAARRIRDEPWGRGIVLVAITGWGQDEDKRRATEAGFDHHLTKPVDPAALEKLLSSPSRAALPGERASAMAQVATGPPREPRQ